MKTIPTAEQREFASALRALLAAESPVDLVRALDEPGADRGTPALWKALADAGVFGLAIAEEYGGAGGSLDDLAVFYTEAGRALCPTTVHSSILAALAIDQLGSPDDKARWLPPVASGNIRATTALYNARDAAVVTPALRADPAAGHWRLDGTVDYVLDADVADLIVVSAAADERTLAFVVDVRDAQHRTARHGRWHPRIHGALRQRQRPPLRSTGSPHRRCAGWPIPPWRSGRSTWWVSARPCWTAPSTTPSCVTSSAGPSRRSRPPSISSPTCTSPWRQRDWPRMRRCSGWDAVASRARETAIARMHAATAARLITLDAHQLHGGMGYVTETDLHLWSERARFGSTFGGGADVAAGWLQQSMHDDEEERP